MPTPVVLVDARPDRRSVMRYVFQHSDVRAAVVAEADGQDDALALVEEHAAALVVIDLPSPVEGGLETVAALRGRFPELGIVVCSFDRDASTKEKALAHGADAYLLKPVSARDVMAAASSKLASSEPMPSMAAAH